ncbi:SDR family NAD(P)-dependent oxidoreductase [Myxococcota bacterium]|nr:SDR family NAD(P)-dependent oxidoreductase [Myxococcota bacterium]MBU1379860.1 SDR family NAD(P)-dependent oxidoreductase [Myxococcota bacterium]MBU1498559.1 SDR family NAD(P)-dependent oxidoreductase [Myxococcota bacterium]
MFITSQNPVFIITGASRGLGQGFTEVIPSIYPGATVFGILRDPVKFNQPKVIPISADLSDPLMAQRGVAEIFQQLNSGNANSNLEFVLINNAGILGPIRKFKDLNPVDLESVFNVNFISAAAISGEFLRQTDELGYANRLVINISSGGGKHPYSGWSSYCSSKAALDMLTAVCALEYKMDEKTAFAAVSPGVLNTAMQVTIRESDMEDFPQRSRFIELYQNDELIDPNTAAKFIIERCRTRGYKNGEELDIRTLV